METDVSRQGSGSLVTNDRLLRSLGAQHESPFPFWEPGGRWNVVVSGEGAYAGVLDRLCLEEFPPKWFLFASTTPRTGKRRDTVQTLYVLFCFTYPIRKFSLTKAEVHFLRPLECVCVEHKRMRVSQGIDLVPEAQRATDIVDVLGGSGCNEDETCPMRLSVSEIAGIGAFAKWDLDKGTYLGDYTGETISSQDVLEARRMEYARGQIGDYIFEAADGCKWIDATFSRCIVKFLNHSCDPNCVVSVVGADSAVRFRTKKKVTQGTELTIDYGFEMVDGKRNICGCGSMNCRGVIERDPGSTRAQQRWAIEDNGNDDDDDEYTPEPKKRSRTRVRRKGRAV